jgi:hypothetical protein
MEHVLASTTATAVVSKFYICSALSVGPSQYIEITKKEFYLRGRTGLRGSILVSEVTF